MKRFAFALVLAAICCVFVAGVFELTVRFVFDDGMQFDLEMWKYAVEVKTVSDNPRIGHVHAPNRHARLMGVDFATNSRGWRDREFTLERPAGVMRIVMLGDSFTTGWGAPYDNIFSKQVERLYAEQGIKAEAINTGVGNWNTVQEVEYFFTEMTPYNPDIVVLNFTVNDAEPVPHEKPPSLLLRHCYSCVYIAGRLDTLMRQMSSDPDWASYYLGLFGDGTTPGWLDAKASIKKLADYCRQHGIKLLIVNHPELHDVQNYRLQPITEFLRSAAKENDVPFVDLLPYLQHEESSALWVTPPDPHPNSLAHKLMAQGIFDALRTLE
jgi:lysophospholipase L1-like esterase